MNQLPTYDYAQRASALCTELAQLLSAEEKAALAAELAKHEGLARAFWGQWRSEHLAEIEQFASATPAERHWKKAWAEPVHRARLVAASLLMLQDGQALLTVLAQYGYGIAAGNSYRYVATQAGQIVSCLFERLPQDPHWPFLEVPSPFEPGQQST